MTIEQVEEVDFIGIDENENIVLTISDHLEWDVGNEHLYLLQQKINSYLSFIESGEVYTSYKNSEGKKFIIHIAFKFSPNEAAIDFLSKVETAVNRAGFGFSWEF